MPVGDPRKRSTTLTNLPAVDASGDRAATVRAPSTTAQTVRATPPTGIRIPPDETAPGSLPGDQTALLREELAKARARNAEFEPLARGVEEAKQATFPPEAKTAPGRKPSPVPSSAPAKVDQAIGQSLRYLLGKAAPFLLAAAGIGGGVTAVAKPSADPAKTDAVLASQEAMRADVALLREQVAGMLKREAARDQYTACLEEVLDDVGEQVLPAQDRLGSAAPLRAYIKQRCRRLRP